MGVNPFLLDMVKRKTGLQVKSAFVPSDGAAAGGGDPAAAGGPPPMDPAMGGAAMGGAPPVDPAAGGGMGGGMPPVDPAMLAAMSGGMPPMGPPPGPTPDMSADIDAKVQGAVTKALQAAGVSGGAGPNGGPGSPKQPKADINTIATDLFQLKKMFLAYLRSQGIELPPDILDGPNRDPATGAPAISPTGGSDVAPGSSAATAAGAIKPIAPIQPAVMNAIGGGGVKSGSVQQLIAPSQLIKAASEVLDLYALYIHYGCQQKVARATRNITEEVNNEINQPGVPIPPTTPISTHRRAAAMVRILSAKRD